LGGTVVFHIGSKFSGNNAHGLTTSSKDWDEPYNSPPNWMHRCSRELFACRRLLSLFDLQWLLLGLALCYK